MVEALCKFGLHLDDYLHMLVPPLVNLFDATKHHISVSQAAMETVAHLAHFLDLTGFASRLIHGIVIIFFTTIVYFCIVNHKCVY